MLRGAVESVSESVYLTAMSFSRTSTSIIGTWRVVLSIPAVSYLIDNLAYHDRAKPGTG